MESIKKHEGFVSKPYIDPLVARYPEQYGIPKNEFEIIKKHFDKLKVTFGYGFTYLDQDEADKVLELRALKIAKELADRFEFFSNLDKDIRDMLVEMAYQLGVGGVSKFKKMLKAIKEANWCEAYKEGKDSRWYRQTTRRAEEVLTPLKKRCQEN